MNLEEIPDDILYYIIKMLSYKELYYLIDVNKIFRRIVYTSDKYKQLDKLSRQIFHKFDPKIWWQHNYYFHNIPYIKGNKPYKYIPLLEIVGEVSEVGNLKYRSRLTQKMKIYNSMTKVIEEIDYVYQGPILELWPHNYKPLRWPGRELPDTEY